MKILQKSNPTTLPITSKDSFFFGTNKSRSADRSLSEPK
jgi:hypothetical protein